MSGIHPYITDYVSKDYGGVEIAPDALNCSLGVSDLPLPKELSDALGKLPPEILKQYPHNAQTDQVIYEGLCARFAPAVSLKSENFLFGDGSFDLLSNLNLLYAGRGRRILCHAPQFTAYIDHCHCIGAEVYSYQLEAGERLTYTFRMEDFIRMVSQVHPHLICCENPINPTGKAIPLAELRELLHAAKREGAALVIDEAYGDYLPMDASAAGLLPEAEKIGAELYVTRSFSKGFGLAGIRMGYVIGSAYGLSQLGKLVTPFNCNAVARYVVKELFTRCPDYPEHLIARTQAANQKLYAAIADKYLLADTTLSTPLCVLSVENPEIDLCRTLAKAGLATVSCATYENMGKNSVRLMLSRELDRLIELLNKAYPAFSG